MTFALNALISSFDGNEIVIQNEEANIACLTLPTGYKVIGVYNITQIDQVIYMLTNPLTGDNEIGYVQNNNCRYLTLINSKCLNFSINNPILQIVVKSTNCGVSAYWTDANNSMRYINFEDLPWVETVDPNNSYKKIKIIGEVDCNKMLVRPNFSIPQANVKAVVEGGKLKTGAYQFVVQYANDLGESYTSFYNVTGAVSIGDSTFATQNFDIVTNKSILVTVNGLDDSGVFDYFNLVVIETINGTSTSRLVGTYPISDSTRTIPYDGLNSANIDVSSLELFQQYPKYDIAGGVTTTDDRLVWYNLRERQRKNYQPIFAKVKTNWISYKIPYNKQEGYYNPMNTLTYKGVMRDEVYPYEACFLLRGGKQSDNFVLVGRDSQPSDVEDITLSNLDSSSVLNSKCDDPLQTKARWEVYNTASFIGFHPDYDPNDSCYKGPYQIGETAYWESQTNYNNNDDIWGTLAGTPIRHIKFPDELVSPRFSVEGDNVFIYPMALQIDLESLQQAIKDSDLTQDEKDEIIGVKVFRGDRNSGNMSVKAKGHFTNVGKYSYQGQDYFFKNYPYNSLKEDPLFAIKHIENHSNYRSGLSLKPFQNNQGQDQLTFMSPDTTFGRVDAINSGYVKMEAIDYGDGQGHFVKVKNNAEYKFTTQKVTMTAAVLATGVAFDVGKKGDISFNGSDFASVFSNTTDLLEKLIPYENMGYNINSKAEFNQSYAIPNEGFKIRAIDTGEYLLEGYNSIESGKLLNNYRRESSVYIHTQAPFKYATDYSPLVPEDNSRFIYSTASALTEDDLTDEQFFHIMTSTQVNAVVALIYGIYSAADELSGGEENFKLVLVQYLTQLIQPYLAANDYNYFTTLQNRVEECADLLGTYPVEPNSTQTFNTKQNIHVLDFDGTDLIDYPIGDGTNGTSNYEVTNTIPYLKSNEDVVFSYVQDEVNLTTYQSSQIDTTCDPGSSNYEECQAIRGMVGATFYGTVTESICGGTILSEVFKILDYAKNAYQQLDTPATDDTLSLNRYFKVNSYYGALKQYLPNQWGQTYSYPVVDTGVYVDLTKDTPKTVDVFGGDTFINEWSFKTKIPVYTTNLVGEHDQKDVALDETGTLGDPMFYISTKPDSFDYKINDKDLATSFEGIGITVKTKVAGSILQTIGTTVMTLGLGITASGIGAVAGIIVTAVGGVLYLLGSIFSNIGSKVTKAMIRIYKDLLKQVIENFGVKNVNLDNGQSASIRETGMFYQYVYGNPLYFVESQVNTDLRQAIDENAGNFYPRVGTGIPDDWLQEDRVPIINDNNYTYNTSFGKQIHETPVTHLPEDFDKNKLCNFIHDNRAFWSEKSDLNETIDKWLIYKPASRFDFPKSFGNLESLDGFLNRQVLARFTNKSQIYNALTTVNTSTFQAYLGNDSLFSSVPLDLSETDTGSMGTQNKFLLKTPHGLVFTDAKRGQVVLLQGQTPKVISAFGMEKWFQQYLPFDVFDDNHFNGNGITGTYDEFYDRLILTKKDTISWTLSFSFKTNTWTSWHSYLPSFYVPHVNYFQSSNNDGTTWDHNKAYTEFTNFYGQQAPYILEYPYVFKQKDEVVQAFSDYTQAFQYLDRNTPIELQEEAYFNKAWVYNNNQTTGQLNLTVIDEDDLFAYMEYPKYNTESKDITLSKTDHYFNFNDIVDIVKDRNKAIFVTDSNPVKQNLQFDFTNLGFGDPYYETPLIRSKDARVRLQLDNRSDIKLLSNINLLQTQESDL